MALPVLGQDSLGSGPRRPRRSRVAKWRALSLVLIHLLIVAHIVHWQGSGTTLASVQFSDLMYTLEAGRINPALILFGAAILATALFGRFFCGWACHWGALQDFCLWLMRRFGVRPRPFRSRLLPYIPVALGLYLFVWPTFKRELLAPALREHWPAALRVIGDPGAFPGFSLHLTTGSLWERLPPPALIAPFLLICGFAAVYFLGSRGFCRYACPYGGILKPAGKLAPGRIAVDPSKCDECGHCTAACHAGVRVLDELRTHGAVVSGDCVRSLDCVSVCPKGALSFTAARPPILPDGPKIAAHRSARGPRRSARRADMTLGWELVLLAVFLFALVATRGVYDAVPLLLAVGVAACTTAVVWKFVQLLRDRDVRLNNFQLKRAGHVRTAGTVFSLLSAAVCALVLHSAIVRYHTLRAGWIEGRVTVPRSAVFAGAFGEIPPEQREQASRALMHYRLAGSWRRGGLGVLDTPSSDVRAAWLHAVRGELAEAEACLSRVVERSGPADNLCADLGRIKVLRGDAARAEAYWETTLAEYAGFEQVREQLAHLYARTGRIDGAILLYRDALDRGIDGPRVRAQLGSLLIQSRRFEEAGAHLRTATVQAPEDPRVHHDYAVLLFMRGRLDDALSVLERGARAAPDAAPMLLARGADMLRAVGDLERAELWMRRASAASGG